jgi:hypothetical protein
MPGSAGRAFSPEPRECFFPWNRCHPTAFEVVVTPIKRLSREGDILEEIGNNVLDQLIAWPAALAGQLIKLRLHVGFETDFHGLRSFI